MSGVFPSSSSCVFFRLCSAFIFRRRLQPFRLHVRFQRCLASSSSSSPPPCFPHVREGFPSPCFAKSVRQLHWLADGARAGDVLFFHYSGHGAQKEDPHGYEEDGMNETIIPVDFQSSGGALHFQCVFSWMLLTVACGRCARRTKRNELHQTKFSGVQLFFFLAPPVPQVPRLPSLCCSESEDSVEFELNSENSCQLHLCFLLFLSLAFLIEIRCTAHCHLTVCKCKPCQQRKPDLLQQTLFRGS